MDLGEAFTLWVYSCFFFFVFLFFTTSPSKSHSVNYRKTSPSTGILRLWEEVVASTTSSPPFTSGSHELNSQSAGVEAEEKTDVKRMQFTNWETTKTTDKLRKKTHVFNSGKSYK